MDHKFSTKISQEAHISWFRHREQYVYPVHIKMWILVTTIVEQVSKCKYSYNFQFFSLRTIRNERVSWIKAFILIWANVVVLQGTALLHIHIIFYTLFCYYYPNDEENMRSRQFNNCSTVYPHWEATIWKQEPKSFLRTNL